MSRARLPVAISGAIFLGMAVLAFKKKHPILIIALCGAGGLILGLLGLF